MINIATNRLFPTVTCTGELSNDIIKDVKQKVKGLIIGKICGVTRTTFDSIFVSLFLGLTYTAIYNNYYFIMNGITMLLMVIYGAIVSGVGNSMVLESIEKNYKDLECMNFLYMWVAGLAAICMLCVYQPFISLVFGDDMLLPFEAMALFCLYFYVTKLGDMLTVYSVAAGLWWESRYRSIVEALGNLCLTYYLGRYFGVYGIIGSTIIVLLVINFTWGVSIVFKYAFHDYSKRQFYISHGVYASVSILAAIVSYLICSNISTVSYGTIVVKIILCMVVTNFIYFSIYKHTTVFKKSIEWVNSKMHIKEKLVRNFIR